MRSTHAGFKRFHVMVNDSTVILSTNDRDYAFSQAHVQRNSGRRGVRVYERDRSEGRTARREVFPDYTSWSLE
jgi:hypothetical protein